MRGLETEQAEVNDNLKGGKSCQILKDIII